ncbi:MAG: DUF2332 domain-containing protein [Solirubrobacterales bacterium]
MGGANAEARAAVAAGLRWQAGWCERLGSPLYRDLLEHAARDVERGGPGWAVLDRAGAAARTEALMRGEAALQLMGAVHRLVLQGRAPALARFYPSTGGTPGAGAATALIGTIEEHAKVLPELMQRPIQTNEVGRSAALLVGFLAVARESGLPLRILEIGASAGLNLRWDRYRYTGPAGEWGDADSPVEITGAFTRDRPPLDVRPEVAERRGCDPRPLDPASEETRLTLLSYTWPDQARRFTQLRAALDFAPSMPVEVDRASAVEWLDPALSEPRPGVATVVFHSVVLPYLGERGIAELWHTLEAAAARARPDAPLAWLSLEAGEKLADVRLMSWPGGEARLLAHASFHGPPVRWAGG